jgi:hypothetical protein
VRANRVAVEVLDDEPAAVHLRSDVVSDRRLARAGKAGEPEGEAATSVGLGLGVFVRVDVLTHEQVSCSWVWRGVGNREVPHVFRKKGVHEGNMVSPVYAS